MGRFAGKKAFITGGSRGIGRATALRLASEGCDVAFSYFTSRDQAGQVLAELSDLDVRAFSVRGNIARQGQAEKMMEAVADEFGGLDFFISNAASGSLKPTMELEEKDWSFSHDAIATAFRDGVRHAAPLMRSRGGGKVVAMASFGATHVLQNYAAIGAAKAAMHSMVRYFAAELAGQNINVNAVSAGIVDTDSLKAFPNYDEVVAHARDRTPARRLTTPDDVAAVVAFLVSDDASWLVGETITVDGGLSLFA